MITHLLVYGTLMPGRGRWPALAPWTSGGPVPDSVSGRLFDTGYGWPAAVIGDGGTIPGFTVPLTSQTLAAALDALDRIEGTDHGLFQRISTFSGSRVPVWVYDWTGPTEQLVPIDRW